MKSFKELNFFKRFVVPVLASLGAIYMIYGAFSSDPLMFLYFSLIVLAFLGVGLILFERGTVTKNIEAKSEI
jgi:APA family basic amino acid/polyamine antiporter